MLSVMSPFLSRSVKYFLRVGGDHDGAVPTMQRLIQRQYQAKSGRGVDRLRDTRDQQPTEHPVPDQYAEEHAEATEDGERCCQLGSGNARSSMNQTRIIAAVHREVDPGCGAGVVVLTRSGNRAAGNVPVFWKLITQANFQAARAAADVGRGVSGKSSDGRDPCRRGMETQRLLDAPLLNFARAGSLVVLHLGRFPPVPRFAHGRGFLLLLVNERVLNIQVEPQSQAPSKGQVGEKRQVRQKCGALRNALCV